MEALGASPTGDTRHVRGHVGDPWNELADRLAKFAAAGHVEVELPVSVTSWINDGTISSLWLILATWARPHLWPELRRDRLHTDTEIRPPAVAPERLFGCPASPCAQPDRQWRPLNLVSMNVQSLEDRGLHSQERRGELRS